MSPQARQDRLEGARCICACAELFREQAEEIWGPGKLAFSSASLPRDSSTKVTEKGRGQEEFCVPTREQARQPEQGWERMRQRSAAGCAGAAGDLRESASWRLALTRGLPWAQVQSGWRLREVQGQGDGWSLRWPQDLCRARLYPRGSPSLCQSQALKSTVLGALHPAARPAHRKRDSGKRGYSAHGFSLGFSHEASLPPTDLDRSRACVERH